MKLATPLAAQHVQERALEQNGPSSATSATMEPSPLTQVERPETFQPKIIRLYETVFRVRVPIPTGSPRITPSITPTQPRILKRRRTKMRTSNSRMAFGRSSSSTGPTMQASSASSRRYLPTKCSTCKRIHNNCSCKLFRVYSRRLPPRTRLPSRYETL